MPWRVRRTVSKPKVPEAPPEPQAQDLLGAVSWSPRSWEGGLLPLRAGAEGHAGAVEPRQQRAAARGEAHVLGASEREGLGAKLSHRGPARC